MHGILPGRAVRHQGTPDPPTRAVCAALPSLLMGVRKVDVIISYERVTLRLTRVSHVAPCGGRRHLARFGVVMLSR